MSSGNFFKAFMENSNVNDYIKKKHKKFFTSFQLKPRFIDFRLQWVHKDIINHYLNIHWRFCCFQKTKNPFRFEDTELEIVFQYFRIQPASILPPSRLASLVLYFSSYIHTFTDVGYLSAARPSSKRRADVIEDWYAAAT